jgi:hypothetical protein
MAGSGRGYRPNGLQKLLRKAPFYHAERQPRSVREIAMN